MWYGSFEVLDLKRVLHQPAKMDKMQLLKAIQEITKAIREERKAKQAKIETNRQENVAEMKADCDAHVQEVVAKTVSAIESNKPMKRI
jgi:hypothetical protein